MSTHHHACTPKLERWPTALPVELIGPELAQVESALNHGNREEAYAAIDRAFNAVKPAETVTLDSPLSDLGMSLRITNGLEAAGVLLVRDLCQLNLEEVLQVPNFGRMYVATIR